MQLSDEELDRLLWECVELVPYVQNIKEHEKSFAISFLSRNMKGIDFNDPLYVEKIEVALRNSYVMYLDFENEIMNDIVRILKQRHLEKTDSNN